MRSMLLLAGGLSMVGCDCSGPVVSGRPDATGALLGLSPLQLDFGLAGVGAQGPTLAFELSNSGLEASGPLAIVIEGPGAASFSLVDNACPEALDLGDTCRLAVRYQPVATGSLAATLTVSANPGGTAVAVLTGFGTSPSGLTLSPAQKTFGNLTVGAVGSAVAFLVKNEGASATGPLAVSLAGDQEPFEVAAGDCAGKALGAGTSCTVQVTFKPKLVGAFVAQLGVSAAPGGSASAQLSGSAGAVPLLGAEPLSLVFGSVALGSSVTRTLTVGNSGGAPTGGLAFALTGPDAADFALEPAGMGGCVTGSPLAHGASCTVRLSFTPHRAGPVSAAFSVSASPGGMATVAVAGQGGNGAALGSNLSAMQFGLVEVGQLAGKRSWILTNTGDAPSGTPQLAFTGQGASAFSFTTDCQGALAPAASCTVTITYAPMQGRNDAATLTASASPGGSVSLGLSGQGGYRVTVNKTGSAASQGIIELGSAGVACGQPCSVLLPPAISLTVRASTAAGSAVLFSGFGPPCPAPRSARSCTFTPTQSVVVDATFVNNRYNVVFVSSTRLSPTLGGVAPYEAECNRLASAAGLQVLADASFTAWLSQPGGAPQARMGLARGFVRVDGRAIADQVTELVGTSPRLWNPVRLDEWGVPVPENESGVLTGVDATGGVDENCNGWKDSGAQLALGSALGGPQRWAFHQRASCVGQHRIYCFQRSASVQLATPMPTVPPGQPVKRVFVTKSTITPGNGVSGFNNLCNSTFEKPLGSGTFRAWVASGGAGAVLPAATYYATPESQLIGLGDALNRGEPLETGIWQAGDLSFPASALSQGLSVWSGSDTPSAAGTATCQDWTSSSGSLSAWVGSARTTATPLWWKEQALGCNAPGVRLYCVEQ